MPPSNSRLLFIASCILVTACGGGGGGDAPDPEVLFPIAGAPTIRVTSPALGGKTDASSIEVRGTAEPQLGTIAALRVNGRAVRSSDGFATWSATVQLSLGPNVLDVEATDGGGNTTTQSVELSVERIDPLLYVPGSIAVDPFTGFAYVADQVLQEIHVLDPATGSRTVLSGPNQGTGPKLATPFRLALDTGTRTLFVYDVSLRAILGVDLLTGDRSILVASSTFPPPNLVQVVAMTVNPAGDELLCVSPDSGLFRVSLVSGELEQVAKPDPASGPAILTPRGVAYDKASGCAFVTDTNTQSVYCIDLVSGDRKLLSSNSSSNGLPFNRPGACILVPGLGLVVVDSQALLAVDLVSGDRAPFSALGVGAGPSFESPGDVALLGSELLVVDSGADGVWRVDPSSGDRELLGSPGIGSGPTLPFSTDFTIDGQGRLFSTVRQGISSYIQRVDLRTGDRRILSSPLVGKGPVLESPVSIDVNPITGELLVVDDRDFLYVVDPETGDREQLEFEPSASATTPRAGAWFPGSSEASLFLDSTVDALVSYDRDTGQVATVAGIPEVGSVIEIDQDDGRALLSTFGRVQAVDLSTGDVTTVGMISFDASDEIVVESFYDIAVDSERDLVYFRDYESEQIGVIDLETLEARLVSSAQRGVGPSFGELGALALTPDGTTLVAYSLFSDALIGIDVVTGDRFLLSK